MDSSLARAVMVDAKDATVAARTIQAVITAMAEWLLDAL